MRWPGCPLNARVLAGFGREVLYAPQAGEPPTVSGVLDAGARQDDAAPGA
jgi:hypothetical protein